jgi:hypothetical protein
MAKYLISNPDGIVVGINPFELATSIKGLWQLDDGAIQASTDEQSARSLDWVMNIDGRRLDGYLLRNGHLVLDGDIRDCSQFTVWYRQQVPQEIKLVFYDESYSADIELTLETTVQDVAAHQLSQDG